MSEEEKKAIAYLKTHIIPYYEDKGKIEFMINDVILNLIEKQQKEIEKLEIELEIKKYCKVNELASDLIFYKNLARDYQGNCISKDKIREIISKYININSHLEYYNQELYGRELADMIKELLEEGDK